MCVAVPRRHRQAHATAISVPVCMCVCVRCACDASDACAMRALARARIALALRESVRRQVRVVAEDLRDDPNMRCCSDSAGCIDQTARVIRPIAALLAVIAPHGSLLWHVATAINRNPSRYTQSSDALAATCVDIRNAPPVEPAVVAQLHMHAHARAHTHAHTRTHTPERTRAHTHTQALTHRHTRTHTSTLARTRGLKGY